MPPPQVRYDTSLDAPCAVLREDAIESGFIGRLQGLKDEYPGGNGHSRKRFHFVQHFIVRNCDRVCLGKAEVGMQKKDESHEGRTRRASGQASTASRRVRRTDRHLRHHQAGKASGMKSEGEPSSFIIHPSNFPIAVQHMVKFMDDDDGNGFIWHTTGSGKTLTSFKVSALLKENDHIHKCVFVVDRKDLDRQTREELPCFPRKAVAFAPAGPVRGHRAISTETNHVLEQAKT